VEGGNGRSSPTRIRVEDKALLASLVSSSTEFASSGIRVVDEGWHLDDGTAIDLIGIDGDQRLVGVLLRTEEDDTLLSDALNLFDWFLAHGAVVEKMVRPHQVNLRRLPRIVVIAPSFPKRATRILSYLSPQVHVELLTYLCLRVNEETMLLLEQEEGPGPKHWLPGPNAPTFSSEIDEEEAKLTMEEIMEFLPKEP
jgi:hypothetical protein